VLAVGMEHDADNRIGVRRELLDDLARPAVPDLDGPVVARGGEAVPIGAERQALNPRLVP
jgi:hypothetical protein